MYAPKNIDDLSFMSAQCPVVFFFFPCAIQSLKHTRLLYRKAERTFVSLGQQLDSIKSFLFYVLNCFVQLITYCCYFWLHTILIKWKLSIIFFLLNGNFWGSPDLFNWNFLWNHFSTVSRDSSCRSRACPFYVVFSCVQWQWFKNASQMALIHVNSCLYSIPTESGEYLA